MKKIKRFEDMEVWQLARKQCIEIESILIDNLKISNQRLKDQLQGSSGSVMDNIAEGFEKENTKEFINFLYHAKASAGEMRSQIIRVMDLKYATTKETAVLLENCELISRQLKGFITYLKNSDVKGTRHVSEPSQGYFSIGESDFNVN